MYNNTSLNESEFNDVSCDGTYSNDTSVMASIHFFFESSIFFVIVGLVGNGLSIAVFSSKEMQTVSSNIYLLALALSDSLYLITVFIRKPLTILRCWYFPESQFDSTNHNAAMCVLFQYFSDLFSDYSTCLILAFTIERSIAVFMPIRYKDLCTVRRAALVCTLLYIIIAILIAPYHFTLMQLYPKYHVCAVSFEYEALFAVLYLIETMLFRLVPVIVIAILNAFIIVRVTKLTRAKNKRRAASKQLIVKGGNGTASGRYRAKQKSRGKGEDRNLQLTVILILVSTSYIILYIPVLIDFILRKLKPEVIQPSEESMLIVGNASESLYICGFAINFFLYTVSGRVFRDQLNQILCHPRNSDDREGNMTVKTMATTMAQEASSVV